MAFKITDVRVGRRTDGTVSAFIDGLGVGVPLAPPVDPVRIGLMLAVFNLHRDCYWSDDNVFETSATPWIQAASPLKKGKVTGWEIRVPAAAGNQPQVFLHLIDPATARPTSGDAAVGWATIQATEKEMSLIVDLLSSKYCFFSPNGLRNTGIIEDLQGWPVE